MRSRAFLVASVSAPLMYTSFWIQHDSCCFVWSPCSSTALCGAPLCCITNSTLNPSALSKIRIRADPKILACGFQRGMLLTTWRVVLFTPSSVHHSSQNFRLSICGQFGISGQGVWRPLPAREQVQRVPEMVGIDKNGKCIVRAQFAV